MNMKLLLATLVTLLPTSNLAEPITISVPSAVNDVINTYRATCTEEGRELELDGDEIYKIWTDELEEAYVIRAAFTCGDLGDMWCGAMGHCPTDLVVGNEVYETNRILQEIPHRISKTSDGTVTYWLPDGVKRVVH